jgi:hypothetical protein
LLNRVAAAGPYRNAQGDEPRPRHVFRTDRKDTIETALI